MFHKYFHTGQKQCYFFDLRDKATEFCPELGFRQHPFHCKNVVDVLIPFLFRAGNSRLLTLLLLYRSGYIVGKYISMEMLIEKTKETYYEALHNSSIEWHNDKSDYTSFARYYLGLC